MDLSLQEKRKTIELFKFLLNEEISKPLGEMNSEAVDNYMKIIFHLQDKCINLSPEFIDEQVRKIFREEENTASPEAVKTTKKYFNKKKVWLVAACIAILVALFSVISFSSERSVTDILEDYLGTFEFISFGDEVDIGNESYGKSKKKQLYKTIETAVKEEKTDLLCPSDTSAVVSYVSVGEKDGKKEINIVFEESDLCISINLDSEISQETLAVCNEKITLNGIEYYLCIMEDVNQVQAYFMHNNNMYYIMHSNEDSLIEILKNMEIIKYEN